VNDLVLIRKNLFRRKLRAVLMIVSILIAFAIYGVLASFERAFNAGQDRATPDRLVSGSTDVSSRFEIHEMSMDNGVMKMRPVAQGIEIKPVQTIELKPGSYHVMFVGLKKPLAQGEPVKATLVFEKAGKVDVTFTVEGIGAQTGGGNHAMPSGGMKMEHGH